MKYPLSTYKISNDNEITIQYNDVYIVDGELIFNTTKKQDIPVPTIFNNIHPFFIHQKDITIKNIDEVMECAVLNRNPFYGNIGHALWDGIYPAYVALCKFGYGDKNFVYINDDMTNHNVLSYQPIKKFSGNGVLDKNQLLNKTIRIKNLIVGNGECGNVCMRKDYKLYGNKWNTLYKFRNRMYEKHGIDQKYKNKKPKIAFIENKRYSDKELKTIEKVCNQYDIPFIRFNKLGDFEKHLEYFSDIDIQITGPGTGMMYSPFLKDGAVIINLGFMEHPQTNIARPNIYIDGYNRDWKFPSFMEQSVLKSVEWCSILYYNRYRWNDIEKEPLNNLINSAIDLYYSDEIQNEHNIDAKIFTEYCKKDKHSDKVCKDLTTKALFCEMMVNEHPLAISEVNIELLRKLRNQFEYDERYVFKK